MLIYNFSFFLKHTFIFLNRMKNQNRHTLSTKLRKQTLPSVKRNFVLRLKKKKSIQIFLTLNCVVGTVLEGHGS